MQLFSLYFRLKFFSLLLLLLPFASPSLHAVDPAKNLSPHFKHWLNEEVPYIIETEERRQFLSLTTDDERENFIKQFWEARNPTPGSEINTYKEEHYERLAYANQNFGNIGAQDGWRTDRGHIYIVLGPPQQKANYPESRNVRPLQIWFYQATNPALPSHFYIVFYKRSIGEDYTLYSPYMDGPTRLVTGLEGKNVQTNNLDILRRSLGDEVARTTLSLIPTEPVNFSDYAPSMQSDVLLSTIKGLADNPITKEMLSERRANERVTTSIFLGENSATLQSAAFRDANGRMIVDYLMAYERPETGIVGLLPDKRIGYSLSLRTRVFTHTGAFVYEQNDRFAAAVNEAQAAVAKNKRFAAEGRLPLVPGEYQIETTLTNELNHLAVRQRADVSVPDPNQQTLALSKVVVFSPQPPVHDNTGQLPFSFSGLRFAPKGLQQVSLHVGESLRLLFQIWNKPADPGSLTGHKIKVHYVYGTMQAGQQIHQEDEEIDAANFDSSGTMLTGRTLSTDGLMTGNYRVVITATDETTQQKAYASLAFHIVPDPQTTDIWTAYDSTADGRRGSAIDDYKRGLSATAQGQSPIAIQWYKRSVEDDSSYAPALTLLIDSLARTGDSKTIAALSNKLQMNHELSQQTAIQMSQANVQIGDYPQATRILEYELQFQPPSSELYLALADIYIRQGNSAKAEDYKRQAAKLSISN
ncbi:GWxTD domain-containing protein [Edaphobacter albus]|uniref:GWxTD domain-containing protein n=1 Tax=Edaphobacter sp. 4G125 TaxID=2763071 RepID=UPI0016495473|nr:GWxTD domain-containing protein [Edaphobacter sp. 4G125]QNI37399.1 GWxTD domain-containing protein [Edaphobacter sp. 4G125]